MKIKIIIIMMLKIITIIIKIIIIILKIIITIIKIIIITIKKSKNNLHQINLKIYTISTQMM
jgi:hypothetical protein